MFRFVARHVAARRRADRCAPKHRSHPPATREPHRRPASLLAVAAAAPLLAGCPQHAPPVDVAYPNDPRVLNGAWQVHVAGLASSVRDLVYAPEAHRLVAWFDGRPATVVAVSVPTGHTVLSVARGSGRSFALSRDGAGSHHLTWWDSVLGTFGGTRHVGAVPDGMHASSNGRVLALWDVRGYRATLVDTAAPAVVRTLRLGVCRSNGVTEASADGRWFLLADCVGNLRIADLAADDLGSTAIGIRLSDRVAFALDGTDIVWIGSDRVVHAFDAASRERTQLARLEDADPVEAFDRWRRHLVVHHAANLVAVATANGMVYTAGLDDAAALRPAAMLPALELSGADLDLTAAPIDPEGADGYGFAGTFTASGAGATGDAWPLTGYVDARDLHRYLPTGPAPSALPPPAMTATASAVDPERGAERFTLSFSTDDRHATTFHGVLHDVAAATSYRVRVERAAADGP